VVAKGVAKVFYVVARWLLIVQIKRAHPKVSFWVIVKWLLGCSMQFLEGCLLV